VICSSGRASRLARKAPTASTTTTPAAISQASPTMKSYQKRKKPTT
jgi:hypothetical protein